METVHGFDLVIDGSGADPLWFTSLFSQDALDLLELGLGGPLTGDRLQEAIGHDLAVSRRRARSCSCPTCPDSPRDPAFPTSAAWACCPTGCSGGRPESNDLDQERLMSTNPFDDENGTFFVLVNDEEQHSLWPTFADVPAGLAGGVRRGGRAECLAYVEQNWTDMRPKSLRDAMAAD